MDDYLFSMCLAEDIVKCVLNSHGIEWKAKSSIKLIYKGKLPELSLEKAILKFIEANGKRLGDILRDYTDNNNSPTVHDFCLYAIEIGSEIFKNGFDPLNFIKYSATVADMAYKLYDHCKDIPEHAAGVIGTVLVSQIMTEQFADCGGQTGLKNASHKLNQMNKKVKNSAEYKTTSF